MFLMGAGTTSAPRAFGLKMAPETARSAAVSDDTASAGTAGSTLTVRDNRTGKEYEIPITDGTVKAADLGQDRQGRRGTRHRRLRPRLRQHRLLQERRSPSSTAREGILEYRGYPIEQLAEKSTFLEVAYLLVHGELPTKEQYEPWVHEITYHTFVHENVKSFMQGFRYDAHPMGMLMASVGALSTFYPESRNIDDDEHPPPADRPDDREDADARRLGLPARAGQAVRLPRQRARLHRQLPRRCCSR